MKALLVAFIFPIIISGAAMAGVGVSQGQQLEFSSVVNISLQQRQSHQEYSDSQLKQEPLDIVNVTSSQDIDDKFDVGDISSSASDPKGCRHNEGDGDEASSFGFIVLVIVLAVWAFFCVNKKCEVAKSFYYDCCCFCCSDDGCCCKCPCSCPRDNYF